MAPFLDYCDHDSEPNAQYVYQNNPKILQNNPEDNPNNPNNPNNSNNPDDPSNNPESQSEGIWLRALTDIQV